MLAQQLSDHCSVQDYADKIVYLREELLPYLRTITLTGEMLSEIIVQLMPLGNQAEGRVLEREMRKEGTFTDPDAVLVEPWLDTSTPEPDTTPTLPRHYPDTVPTPRHSDTSVNRHSARHSDTSVRPVSSHLDSGPPRTVSMVSSRCQDKNDTPTLDTSDTPDTPTLRHYRPRC